MQRDEDFFQIFGRIAVFFATLDVLVTLTILRLVRHDHSVNEIAMNERTTLQQKFYLIQKLQASQVIDPKLLGELHALMPTALKIGERRNRFTHDQWLFDPKNVSEGRISRLRIRGLSNWRFELQEDEELTIDALYQFLDEIGQLQKQFAGFSKRLS